MVSTMSLVRAVSLEPAPTPQEDLSDSEDDRDEDGIDDCDRVSSEDSGTDDSSDEDEDEPGSFMFEMAILAEDLEE